MDPDLICPSWPAPAGIEAVVTTRRGGVSTGRYDSFNLALHVGDAPATVLRNRARLGERLGLNRAPQWLDQTHGTALVEAGPTGSALAADAVFTRERGLACAILTADCLPILLCSTEGDTVLAVHAGWRGLLAGIIPRSLAAPPLRGCRWHAWIGPGISCAAYAVGPDFAPRLRAVEPAWARFLFEEGERQHADLPGLAAWQLERAGVVSLTRYAGCTYSEPENFYSYRRDGETGRMAALIWRS